MPLSLKLRQNVRFSEGPEPSSYEFHFVPLTRHQFMILNNFMMHVPNARTNRSETGALRDSHFNRTTRTDSVHSNPYNMPGTYSVCYTTSSTVLMGAAAACACVCVCFCVNPHDDLLSLLVHMCARGSVCTNLAVQFRTS